MEFEPIPDLEHRGFRLASADDITKGATSGDAFLVAPDGSVIDLWWRSGQPEPSATWSPPTMPGSLGVITVAITDHVGGDDDLGPVLEAATALMEPILAAGIDLPR